MPVPELLAQAYTHEYLAADADLHLRMLAYASRCSYHLSRCFQHQIRVQMGLLDKILRRKKGDDAVGTDSLVVVYTTLPGGLNGEEGTRLRALFNSAGAIDWHFLNPGSFQAYFSLDESGRAHASSLIRALSKFRAEIESLADLKIGTAEGPLVVSRRPDGGLNSVPLGEPVNRAMRVAH